MEVKSAPTTTQPTTAGVTPPQTPPPAPLTEATTASTAPPAVESTAPVTEGAKPDAKTPEVDPPQKFPKQFAIIAKREKAITEREKALKSAEPELKTLRDVQKAIKDGRKLEAIQALGLTYDDLTNEALSASGGNPLEAENKALKAKLAKLEGKSDEPTEEAQHAAKVEKAKEVITQFKGQIQEHVTKAKEAYPLIAEGGHHELVFDVIDQHHAKHGVLLTVDQAAAAVEQHLEAEARKLLTHPKFAPKSTASAGDTGASKQEPSKQAPTLKKNDAPVSTKQDYRRMSQSDRIAAVAAKVPNLFKE